MIQFNARLTSDRTILMANVGMAERLNLEYHNAQCPSHPDKKSIAEVDCSHENLRIRVLQSCCPTFEARLLHLNSDITSLRDA